MGLQFGIWIEPEMVSEDSDLYRTHPEWCLRAPGRPMTRGRNQLVLDLSREDVCGYLIDVLDTLLSNARIEYLKWDMNRSISDVWSGLLPRERQGEAMHRYVLGLYRILEEITAKHPRCCSAAAAAEAGGMIGHAVLPAGNLVQRQYGRGQPLKIQYGTSFAYPVNTMEAHVSVCPTTRPAGRYL